MREAIVLLKRNENLKVLAAQQVQIKSTTTRNNIPKTLEV